jgi:hypothetical protein
MQFQNFAKMRAFRGRYYRLMETSLLEIFSRSIDVSGLLTGLSYEKPFSIHLPDQNSTP